jgi:hypothetical protein
MEIKFLKGGIMGEVVSLMHKLSDKRKKDLSFSNRKASERQVQANIDLCKVIESINDSITYHMAQLRGIEGIDQGTLDEIQSALEVSVMIVDELATPV